MTKINRVNKSIQYRVVLESHNENVTVALSSPSGA